MERKKGQRIVGASREKLAKKMVREYQAGKSIRALAVDHNVSIGTARNLLVQSGVEFRSRGGATKKYRKR